MTVLYDNTASTNGLKVRFLIGELGIAVERVHVDLAAERPAWYRAIHPFATVPCLVDGDLVVPESNTMLRYLAAREGRDDLYPADLRVRAHVDALLDALSLQVRPALWEAERVLVYGEPATHDWRPALDAALDGWERMLRPGGYATGAFSIADCAALGRLAHVERLEVDLARRPRLAAQLETVGARPAYRAALVA